MEEDLKAEEKDSFIGKFCEVCDLPAESEYGGFYYCDDCYETEILHQGNYNFIPPSKAWGYLNLSFCTKNKLVEKN